MRHGRRHVRGLFANFIGDRRLRAGLQGDDVVPARSLAPRNVRARVPSELTAELTAPTLEFSYRREIRC